MDTKKWMLLVVMVGALLATAFGQNVENVPGEDIDRQGRKQFLRTKIAPLITEERLQLDKQISSEDQKTIDALKERMKSQRLLMLELQCEMRAMKLNGELPADGLKSELKAQATVIKNTREQAKALTDKYDQVIDQHLEKLKEELFALRNEIPQKQGSRQNGEGRGRKQSMGRMGPDGPSRGNLTRVGFLLWDTERS